MGHALPSIIACSQTWTGHPGHLQVKRTGHPAWSWFDMTKVCVNLHLCHKKSTKYVTSQAWVRTKSYRLLQTYKGNVIWRGSTLEGPGLVCHGFFHLHACTQKTVFRVFWSSLHISGGRTVSKCKMKSQFWKVNHVNLQSTHSGTLFWGTKPDSPTTLAKLPIHCQVPHAACEWMKSPSAGPTVCCEMWCSYPRTPTVAVAS